MQIPESKWLPYGLMMGAVALPLLLGYNRPPSPTLINELVSLGGWGVVVACLARYLRWEAMPWRSVLPAFAALVLLLVASMAAGVLAAVVKGPVLAFAAMVAAASAVLIIAAGGAAASSPVHAAAMRAFHVALVLAGIVSALISMVQIFAPDWCDGVWVASALGGGRAVGNLRQSNLLSTSLVLAAAALVSLVSGGHLRPRWGWLAMATLMIGVVLSGSRTGTLGTLMLALWGILDRRLNRRERTLLLAVPLLYLASWLVLLGWAEHTGTALTATDRLSTPGGQATANRLIVWRNALDLVAMNPWRGVGFGEFNFALMLTPFEYRSNESPTHAHNLLLQLAVELGVPFAVVIATLLTVALLCAWRGAWPRIGGGAVETRAAFVMLLLVAIHSQLEYPLWYAFFLLPSAWALGACLGAGAPVLPTADLASATAVRRSGLRRARRGLTLAGIAMAAGAGVAWQDYRRVSSVFTDEASLRPMPERIADAQGSWFFAHYADYAAAVSAKQYSDAPLAFARAPHFILDEQMLRAWSRALAQRGDLERARHVAQRLKDLGTPVAKRFFAPCEDPAIQPEPYQCQPPAQRMDWRQFRWLEVMP